MRRRSLIAAGAALLAAPRASFAQAPEKVWRIGYLGPDAPGVNPGEAVLAGLRDFGYVEGRNLHVEFRWAHGKLERLPALAMELVALKPDAIVTMTTNGVRAAKAATTTIPIVMGAVGDAVTAGLVASLARPGGNVTGSSFLAPELYPKRLEMLTEVLPRATRFAFLNNPGNPNSSQAWTVILAAARTRNVYMEQAIAGTVADFDGVFAALQKARIDGVIVSDDGLFLQNRKPLAALAEKHRLALAAGTSFAEAGGLLGYGANLDDVFRRVGYFVDRIFKGAKPADLPVEQPTKFELVINMKTARALGITMPRSLLLRADEVIQ